MRGGPIPVALLVGGALLSGCYSGEDMGEAEAGDLEVAAGGELDCYIARGTFEETQDRPSPLRRTDFTIGGSRGLLCYGAPSARDRDVMGSLVPYGQPWRIGANESTSIHLSGPADIGGAQLQAGSYSIYAIPGDSEWRFLINSNWERWGIPIDGGVRSTEIAGFVATPQPIDNRIETLTYGWEPQPDGTMGHLFLEWENTRVSFPVRPSN